MATVAVTSADWRALEGVIAGQLDSSDIRRL